MQPCGVKWNTLLNKYNMTEKFNTAEKYNCEVIRNTLRQPARKEAGAVISGSAAVEISCTNCLATRLRNTTWPRNTIVNKEEILCGSLPAEKQGL